jgi:hypothetical protein
MTAPHCNCDTEPSNPELRDLAIAHGTSRDALAREVAKLIDTETKLERLHTFLRVWNAYLRAGCPVLSLTELAKRADELALAFDRNTPESGVPQLRAALHYTAQVAARSACGATSTQRGLCLEIARGCEVDAAHLQAQELWGETEDTERPAELRLGLWGGRTKVRVTVLGETPKQRYRIRYEQSTPRFRRGALGEVPKDAITFV